MPKTTQGTEAFPEQDPCRAWWQAIAAKSMGTSRTAFGEKRVHCNPNRASVFRERNSLDSPWNSAAASAAVWVKKTANFPEKSSKLFQSNDPIVEFASNPLV